MIYWETGQSAANKRDPATLRDILSLPSSQPLPVKKKIMSHKTWAWRKTDAFCLPN